MAKVLFKYQPATLLPGMQSPAGDGQSKADAAAESSSSVKSDRWWYESSYDLRHGLQVDDEGGDTVPGDLFDELFKP